MDTHCTYVFDVRYGRFLTVISIVVLVGGCGEIHPTAESPDDTHSVGEGEPEIDSGMNDDQDDGQNADGSSLKVDIGAATMSNLVTSTSSLPSVS